MKKRTFKKLLRNKKLNFLQNSGSHITKRFVQSPVIVFESEFVLHNVGSDQKHYPKY